MKYYFVFAFLVIVSRVAAQPLKYTVANTHSHNDYEQNIPFWAAYNAGFGSIEVDIFLENGGLYVAHDTIGLKAHRTLEQYYIHPLVSLTEKKQGYVFGDSGRQLQLLIDIKTDSVKTLEKLIKLLQKYPSLINNPSLRFVITGNRPAEYTFTTYPSFIQFDGVLSKSYSKEALSKISMLSDNLRNYTNWKGEGMIPRHEMNLLKQAVDKAHQLQKPVRFWGAPDFMNAWQQFMQLQVDYINTDRIDALASFIKNMDKKSSTE